MGETLQIVIPGFNRSLRIESRVDRLTGDPRAVLLRAIVEQSGNIGWMTASLTDQLARSVADDIRERVKNTVHQLDGTFRQSVNWRLAGCAASTTLTVSLLIPSCARWWAAAQSMGRRALLRRWGGSRPRRWPWVISH